MLVSVFLVELKKTIAVWKYFLRFNLLKYLVEMTKLAWFTNAYCKSMERDRNFQAAIDSTAVLSLSSEVSVCLHWL